MIRTLFCTTALLVAAPAMAQTTTPAAPADGQATTPAAQTPAAQTPTAQTPAAGTAQPAGAGTSAATQATGQATGTTATQAATPQGAATSGSQVAAVVEAEFPAYDADKSGSLNQSEFVAWMTALKQKEIEVTGKAMPAAEIATWANGAFASADGDTDKMVSKAELLKYLGA